MHRSLEINSEFGIRAREREIPDLRAVFVDALFCRKLGKSSDREDDRAGRRFRVTAVRVLRDSAMRNLDGDSATSANRGRGRNWESSEYPVGMTLYERSRTRPALVEKIKINV